MEIEPDLKGMEAPWTGLIVAEAALSSDRPISSIRIVECLATQSFAVARSAAIWPRMPIGEALDRLDAARLVCRGNNGANKADARWASIREALFPIWTTLLAISAANPEGVSESVQPLVVAVMRLLLARSRKVIDEGFVLAEALEPFVPEADQLNYLQTLTPEKRVELFDLYIAKLGESRKGDTKRTHALAMLAGYVSTVAAGGQASLSLAARQSDKWPEVMAWAYVLGGLGEQVVWTSSFDGLGRLISRELERPVRIDEPPTCDFAIDEALVLADRQLRDPLVHLRVKQARIVTVATAPGVNVSIPLADQLPAAQTRAEALPTAAPSGKTGEPSRPPATSSLIELMVEELWAHLAPRVESSVRNIVKREQDSQAAKSKKRASTQSELPISGKKRY